MDFQFDMTADGRRLKFLNLIDEHSCLCLAIRVGMLLPSQVRGGRVGRADQHLHGNSVHP